MTKIVTVPHPALRTSAVPITAVDKKTQLLIQDLDKTLRNQKDPQGVGLAAPQLATNKQVFVTYLADDEHGPSQITVFINPEIIDHSSEVIFGKTPEDEYEALEGCLSIPGLYGAVPRFSWIEIKYDQIVGDALVTHQSRFTNFAARVVQHEFDHLNGVLFTDYSLEYDLPVYRENPETEKLVEIDKRILEAF